jgi:hypothetical protein
MGARAKEEERMKGILPLIVHFSLLIVAAASALAVYSGNEEKAPVEGVPILDIRLSDIEHISYAADTKIVEIGPREGGGFTVSVYKRDEDIPDPEAWDKEEEPEAADEKAVEGGVPDGMEDDTETSVYRASKALDDMLEKTFPLKARRRLGELGADELGRFGFTEGGGTLIVKAKGQEATFEVGSSSYGGATTYLRERPGGAVFLVDAGLIRSLDITPPRYLERRLVDLTKETATGVSVTSGGKTRKLVKVGAGKDAKWADEAHRDAPSEMIANWVAAVFRLSAAEYLAEGEAFEPTALATLEFEKDGAASFSLTLAWASGEDEKKEYYARSTYTGGWVKLNRFGAESVASDLPSIVDGN